MIYQKRNSTRAVSSPTQTTRFRVGDRVEIAYNPRHSSSVALRMGEIHTISIISPGPREERITMVGDNTMYFFDEELRLVGG